MKNSSWVIDKNEMDWLLTGAAGTLMLVIIVCCSARCLLFR